MPRFVERLEPPRAEREHHGFEFAIIPYMESDAGRSTFGWLLGDGEARGIALVFLVAGIVMVLAAVAAFFTRSYRRISAQYLEVDESAVVAATPARAE